MLVLRNLYTTKILPHSNATESIGKYKRKISLATRLDWRGLALLELREIRSGARPFEI